MQLKYNKKAEEAGVHIVGACGYDSVPADMGVWHMIKNFKGKIELILIPIGFLFKYDKILIHKCFRVVPKQLS